MSEVTFGIALRWLLAAPLLGVGAWILLFNVLRYTPIVQRPVEGRAARLPSSVSIVGTLFVWIGISVAPIVWHPAYLLVVLLEIFSIDFTAASADDEAGEQAADEAD